MAPDHASRDANMVTTLLAVSTADGLSPVLLWADPIKHALLVTLGGGVFPNTLSLEIPSGTVNGSNTSFTVTNNPIFEEVSGQVMLSQSQDATNYGYTISGTGPYTLAFTNAPTQTPHSFYNVAQATTQFSQFFETDTFTATANQTLFTTTLTPLFVFSVIVQDQPQTLTQDYTQVTSAFTLNSGVPAGTVVTITYLHA